MAWRWTLGLATLIATSWLALSWYVADQFLSIGLKPYSETEEVEVLQAANLTRIPREAITFQNGTVLLAGSFFEHPNPNNCAVILLPGIGGNRTQVLPALSIFYSQGCHVLAYDPRGTGASSPVLRTFGDFERDDNVQAIEWLAQRTNLSLDRIGIWGPSFGAAVALLTLERLPSIGFVIADSTFSDFETVARETITQLSHPLLSDLIAPLVLQILEIWTGMNTASIQPQLSIQRATSPVLLIHAKADPAMDLAHSMRVFENRTSPDTLLEITDWGAGHADSAVVDPEAYAALIKSFFAKYELAHESA